MNLKYHGNYLRYLPTLFFALGVVLFFGLPYRYHLYYGEQFQLFLYTKEYLTDMLCQIGGIGDYLGRFITQFYFHPWVGALWIGILLSAVQILMQHILRKFKVAQPLEILSFIPSLLLWAILCDENMLITSAISLVVTLGLVVSYLAIKTERKRTIFFFITLLFLSYGFGTWMSLLFWFQAIGWEYNVRQKPMDKQIAEGICAFLLILCIPFLAKRILLFPLVRLWWGSVLYRFSALYPVSLILLFATTGLLPFLLQCLSRFPIVHKKITAYLSYAGMLLLLVAGARQFPEWTKEQSMRYDFLTRTQRWDLLLRNAETEKPTDPVSVCCINLALGKKGILGDKMFDFYQRGPEGLIPSYQRDFNIPMITNEIYYHLGFINTAQRFVFEAMEAIPDGAKSVRAIKRLTETNIINGQYELADKYLTLLENTLFYDKWARKTRRLLYRDDLVDAHPELGTLRKMRFEQDFLFSEREKDMMLGILSSEKADNTLARDYLLGYYLLAKDLPAFRKVRGMVKTEERLPKSHQEALLYLWGLSNQDPFSKTPFPVSDHTKRAMRRYGELYTTQSNPESILKKDFSHTYWYYFHFVQ